MGQRFVFIPRNRRIIRAGSRLFLFLALVFIAVFALFACFGISTDLIETDPTAGGDAQIRIEQPGLSRIMVRRPKETPQWKNFILKNTGPGLVRKLSFWGQGNGLLLPNEQQEEDSYTTFELLPEERFICSAGAIPGKAAQPGGQNANPAPGIISGNFLWEMPKEAPRIHACLSHNRRAAIEAGQIVLQPGGRESHVDFHFSSPLPHVSACVAWQVSPGDVIPQVWINTSGEAWGRLTQGRDSADWLHPLDLTTSVEGHSEFWLRITYDRNEKRSQRGSRPLPEDLNILLLRVEREVQGNGALREWRAGGNPLSVSFTSPQQPNLEIQLLSLQ